MKVWGAIFNLFAVVIIAFLLILFTRMDKVNTKQFEEIRLRYAVDYAVEAAFRSTISVEDIGIDYADIDNVTINPSLALETFKSILCLSYNMSLSEENFRHIENAIPTGILFANDGYYILDMAEYDSTPGDATGYTQRTILNGVATDTHKATPQGDNVPGNEYRLQWSVKKPYIVSPPGNYIYAVNIYNESWTSVPKTGAMIIEDGQKFTSAARVTGITRDMVRKSISDIVTKDINYIIYNRNIDNITKSVTSNSSGFSKTPMFYLPAGQSVTAINEVKRPTLMMFLQGVDFANGMKLDATSVGGTRVTRKRQVAGFLDGTQKYYCYEKQLPAAKLGSVVEFFPSMEQAALAGYKPHFVYLSVVVPRD